MASIFKNALFVCLLIAFSTNFLCAQAPLKIVPGDFKPTEESLKNYTTPEWFRNAKFGIWAHWGPQAVPRQGDWYARNMYLQGSRQNRYHVANYGHPSKFGYKDVIALWKAEKWDPEKLMAFYKKVGARYFVSMASHHDNFFLYNSTLNPFNSLNMGPKKDVVGLWQKAAKKQGLNFGVSEHTGASYRWYQSSHAADTSGAMKGIPYDGSDPKYAALYHQKIDSVNPYKPGNWFNIPYSLKRDWYYKVKELVDTYHPDLLYSDAPFNWEDISYGMLANFYNGNTAHNGGKNQAVYNSKDTKPGQGLMFVEDLERSVKEDGSPVPWQTDTSIGDWFYRTGQKYKTSTEIIQMLVDIVSKNGNMLLNVVQTPEGDIESDVLQILNEIGAWTSVNGEGIYGSRPWKVWGEKPADQPAVKFEHYNNEGKVKYSARDIRFTVKGNTLYAFALGAATEDIKIVSLGKKSKYDVKQIASVKMLGSNQKLNWKQEDGALVITKPAKIPAGEVTAFKVEFK
ncbi:MAG: alpha-L-fucosidase [Pyrinomonadaceae bacterium]|nr:alpha-L-fucosidase [Sphingobacteriaceae bacterium]